MVHVKQSLSLLLVVLACCFIISSEAGILDWIFKKNSAKSKIGPFCKSRYENSKSKEASLPSCVLSIDDITNGRSLPGNVARASPFPPWFNLTLARRGQDFGQKYRFSLSIGALQGLLTGLAVPDAHQVISFTNRSDTNARAWQRYLGTVTQMYVWFDALLDTDWQNPDNAFINSLQTVRALHINAANRARATNRKPLNAPDKYDDVEIDDELWEALEADLQASDFKQRTWTSDYLAAEDDSIYFNQFAQGITIAGFMGYPIMHPQSVFIYDYTEEDLQGWLHLWAFIGYALGVEDEYNVCLQKDSKTAAEYYIQIKEKYCVPGLFQIDRIGKHMVESLVKAYNNILPGVGFRALMTWLMRDFYKIPVANMLSKLTAADKAVQQYFDNIFVPTTRLATTRLTLNTALESGINSAIVAVFGPLLNELSRAEHGFYPNLEEDATNSNF